MSPDPIHNSLLFADKPTREHRFLIMRSRYTILTLLLVLLGTSCQRQTAEAPVTRPGIRPAVSPNPAAKAPGRPVFPYSVVSGGLTDSKEMADAIQQDPVVREHYAGLRPASFRPEVLPADRKGYVSYRIRGKVFWSRRLMTLKKGETVLTDGDTMLRGRCGNRVSSVAMSPTAPEAEEPTEAVLNSWQDSRLLAGIPPVPVASPIDGTLNLDRSAPTDPQASSLLVPLDSEVFGFFLPTANPGSPGGFWISGGSPNGAGGGGNGGSPGGDLVGGGTPPSLPPGSIPGTDPGPVPPVSILPPNVIASLPPVVGLPLPPETSYFVPPIANPPAIEPPNVNWPPTTSYPPATVPPGVVPPGTTPPSTPPSEVPPGAGDPPPSNPPTVSDPPPGFPPPGPPEEETAVPEPATVLLAASALALLGAGRYFTRRR